MGIRVNRASVLVLLAGATLGIANAGIALAQSVPPPPPVFPTPPSSATPAPLTVQAPPPRPAVPAVQPPVIVVPAAPQVPPSAVRPPAAPAATLPDVVNHVDDRSSAPLWLILVAIGSLLVNLCWLGMSLYRRYGLPWNLGAAGGAVAD